MHRIFTAVTGLIATCLAATAIDFTSTAAGSLATSLTDAAKIGELRLSGPVDASDLYFIGREMNSLTVLDLSGAIITAYSGEALQGISRHDANTIPAGAFAGTAIGTLTLPSAAGLRIGDAAFAGTAVKDLTIPANVSHIGCGAFCGCKELTSAVIESDAASGGHVFAECTALRSITYTMPAAIGDADFSGCTALEQANNIELATSIGDGAFASCGALSFVGWGVNLQRVGERAFYGSGIKAVEAAGCRALAEIGAWAFADCPRLLRAELPDNITAIGQGAFSGCSSLCTVNLPAECRNVADFLFHGDTLLDSDGIMHDGVESIGAYAFKDNTRASQIHIPVGLSYIDDGAMEGMTALRSIFAKGVASVAELGEEIWHGIDPSQVFLYVDESMADAFRAADQWREFNISTNSLTGVQPEGISHVSATFAGRMLVVSSDTADIAAVTVYDIDGHRIAADAAGPYDIARIDTSHCDDHVFVVDTHMADGSHRIFKLARP